MVGVAVGDALLDGWRARVARAGSHLQWPVAGAIARQHPGGATLAIAAPYDQAFLATEVNEWALCAALVERDPTQWSDLEALLAAAARDTSAGDASSAAAPGHAGDTRDLAAAPAADPGVSDPPVLDEPAAFARFARLALRESRPALRSLLHAAAGRQLAYVVDDDALTLGAGTGGCTYGLTALPPPEAVPWDDLHNIPTALVTGSNGKTTTVRLLAACARAQGWAAGYNCTDGVYLDDTALAKGDYSGPAGARWVLRERRIQAAILETARGGILRRGIAVSHADVAVVTNVSPDHFGEYGIYDLAGVADAKLSVAAAVTPAGLLVLNADDPYLQKRAAQLAQRFGRVPALGWFSTHAAVQVLPTPTSRDASSCCVRHGRLEVRHGGRSHDLGAIADMPLTVGGAATYNVANLAGAALAAIALGIAAPVVADVFARFGSNLTDNPGRLMRFTPHGVTVLVDYAHNPDGLRGFLQVAEHVRTGGQGHGAGRLGLLLGQAGNRANEAIEELARVAAEFRPALCVIKENETQLRGRAPGEVPRILRTELLRLGMPADSVPIEPTEVDAARRALDWALAGDVLAFPIHSSSAKAAVLGMLMSDRGAG